MNLTIIIDEASVEGEFAAFPCELTDGTLSVNGKTESNCISLPLDCDGTVVLELQPMWAESVVTFRGSHIRIVKSGEPKYLQDFKGLKK